MPVDPSFIDKALDKMHEESRRNYAQTANRASQGGVTCARRLLWHRTRGEDAALPELGLQRRFALGHIYEDIVVDWLKQAGIKVTGSQRDLRWREFELTGRIDGEIDFDGERAIFECKSCSEFVFRMVAKCSTAADLVALRKDYITGYVTQTGLYLFQSNKEDKQPVRYGLLVFINKNSGETHTIIVDALDRAVLDLVEAHLKRLERVNKALHANEDIEAEPGEYCERCPFLGACSPQRSFGPGMGVAPQELVELVEERQRLASEAAAYDACDRRIRELTTQPGDILAGRWLIRVQSYLKTKYDVPEAVRNQYAQKQPELRRSYVAVK